MTNPQILSFSAGYNVAKHKIYDYRTGLNAWIFLQQKAKSVTATMANITKNLPNKWARALQWKWSPNASPQTDSTHNEGQRTLYIMVMPMAVTGKLAIEQQLTYSKFIINLTKRSGFECKYFLSSLFIVLRLALLVCNGWQQKHLWWWWWWQCSEAGKHIFIYWHWMQICFVILTNIP